MSGDIRVGGIAWLGLLGSSLEEQVVVGVWSADPAPGLQALLRPLCVLLLLGAPATACQPDGTCPEPLSSFFLLILKAFKPKLMELPHQEQTNVNTFCIKSLMLTTIYGIDFIFHNDASCGWP